MNALFERSLRDRAGQAGISLTDNQIAQFSEYYELLARWARTINLTSLPLQGYPAGTLDRLLIEPAIAARHFPKGEVNWFDFGSGGGSPAIPLKILRREEALVMVESRERKAAFLREVIRSLRLEKAGVVVDRAESLAAGSPAGVADLITMRAVRLDQDILHAAAHLLHPGGTLLVFASAALAGPLASISETGFAQADPVLLPAAGDRLFSLTRK